AGEEDVIVRPGRLLERRHERRMAVAVQDGPPRGDAVDDPPTAREVEELVLGAEANQGRVSCPQGRVRVPQRLAGAAGGGAGRRRLVVENRPVPGAKLLKEPGMPWRTRAVKQAFLDDMPRFSRGRTDSLDVPGGRRGKRRGAEPAPAANLVSGVRVARPHE